MDRNRAPAVQGRAADGSLVDLGKGPRILYFMRDFA